MARKRFYHLLETTASRERPRYMVFFDSEARPVDNIHHPYLLCGTFVDRQTGKHTNRDYAHHENLEEYFGITGIDPNEFPALEQFWTDVAEYGGTKNKKVMVYAHNMTYDVINTAGVPCLVKLGFTVESFFEKGPAFIMKLEKRVKTGKVKIMDDVEIEEYKVVKTIMLISTTNYFASTLAKLGESFNQPKGDYDLFNGTFEDAVIYCRQDVKIIEIATQSFVDFIDNEDLGSMGHTLASQSFKAFRNRFLKHEVHIHTDERCLELERLSYSGGRVECFKVGKFKGKFYYLDINSMYPYVMKVNKYPVKKIAYSRQGSLGYVWNQIQDGYLVTAKCLVKTDKPVYPVKVGPRLIFPVGEYWTALSTPEIIYGIENNLIVQIKEVAIYEGAEIFSAFVDHFYEGRQKAKKEGNAVLDFFYKIFLNSLYGKFAQKSEVWERVGDSDPNLIVGDGREWDPITGELIKYKIFGGSRFEFRGEEESFDSFPAVAAHVTAHSRMMIWGLMEEAGRENIYYGDTDSIFTNERGKRKLKKYIDPNILGMLKIEDQSDTLEIHAPKDYRFAKLLKMKGVKKNSVQIRTLGRMPVYEQKFWPRFKSLLNQGQLGRYYTDDREKILSRQYLKGWVYDDGRVEPFTMIAVNGVNYITPPKIFEGLKVYQERRKNKYYDISQLDLVKKKYKGNFTETNISPSMEESQKIS